MIQISETDEHIRALLDRKGKIEHLKMETINTIKEFAYTRTLTAIAQPPPQVIETRTFGGRSGNATHTIVQNAPVAKTVVHHAPVQRTTTVQQTHQRRFY